MIVVSDASPIVALARIERLDLLRYLYGRVVVPQAVHDEVRAGEPGLDTVLAASWIETRMASDEALVASLLPRLDRGEAEAIALAIECHADLLLMDERRGRGVAEERGLRVVGTLGVLIAAKQARLVAAIAPLVVAMVTSGSFHVSDDLRRRVLLAAGEEGAEG